MKKCFLCFAVIAFYAIFMMPVLTQAQIKTKKVAVWDTKCTDNSITVFQSTMIRGGMETAVGNASGYEVYDRSAFDAIMKEHNFQRSGAVNEDEIKNLGMMAGVQFIIVPEAICYGNDFYIVVKMLDVETGKFGGVFEELCGSSGTEIKKACSNIGERLFGTSVTADAIKDYQNEKEHSINTEANGEVSQETISKYKELDNYYYGLGVDNYNNGKYHDAMAYFKQANDAAIKIGLFDEAAMINYALSAIKLGKYDMAVSTYYKLMSKGYDDQDLANSIINAYLTDNKESEIINIIEHMAQESAEQPVYYFILGTIYGNRESSMYDLEKALKYYDNAIAVDKAYADAYYNASALLIDKASDIYQEANQSNPSEYSNFNAYIDATDKMVARAKVYDERALPYLEKTYKLLPDDQAVKHALRGVYQRLKMIDKANSIK